MEFGDAFVKASVFKTCSNCIEEFYMETLSHGFSQSSHAYGKLRHKGFGLQQYITLYIYQIDKVSFITYRVKIDNFKQLVDVYA